MTHKHSDKFLSNRDVHTKINVLMLTKEDLTKDALICSLILDLIILENITEKEFKNSKIHTNLISALREKTGRVIYQMPS